MISRQYFDNSSIFGRECGLLSKFWSKIQSSGEHSAKTRATATAASWSNIFNTINWQYGIKNIIKNLLQNIHSFLIVYNGGPFSCVIKELFPPYLTGLFLSWGWSLRGTPSGTRSRSELPRKSKSPKAPASTTPFRGPRWGGWGSCFFIVNGTYQKHVYEPNLTYSEMNSWNNLRFCHFLCFQQFSPEGVRVPKS